MDKFKNTIEIPIYKTGNLQDGLNVFYIDPESAIKHAEGDETNLFKITLNEDVNCIPLTNIMNYNNTNQTLPLGMNVTDGVLINTKKMKVQLKQESQNNIVKTKRKFTKARSIKNKYI